MSNLKYGAAVETKGDLQNLITGMILRQTEHFTAEDIHRIVNEKLVGSFYHNHPDLLLKIQETIGTLFVIDCLKSDGKGTYGLCMSFPAINKR